MFTIMKGMNVLEIRKIVIGPWDENCYILICPVTHESIIVDPGADAAKIADAAKGARVKAIVITHGHPDHIGAIEQVQAHTGAPVACHPADAAALPRRAEIALQDGAELVFGSVRLTVLHTPGHTPGSICLYGDANLIAGDTIFPGGPGRTNTPDDLGQIIRSLQYKIFTLPDETCIHPGHGASTTVGAERSAFEAFLARPRPASLCGDVVW